MRVSKWTLLWLSIVVVLIVIWGSMLAGVIRPADILLNLYTFIFALVIIAILAIIGAVFVGIFVSHRILSAQGFTPFEREMLEMREDVKKICDRINALEKTISEWNSGKDEAS